VHNSERAPESTISPHLHTSLQIEALVRGFFLHWFQSFM